MEIWDAYDGDFNRIEGETVAWRWVSREALLGMRDDELLGKRIYQYVGELRE